jgi:hypothetical protein
MPFTYVISDLHVRYDLLMEAVVQSGLHNAKCEVRMSCTALLSSLTPSGGPLIHLLPQGFFANPRGPGETEYARSLA